MAKTAKKPEATGDKPKEKKLPTKKVKKRNQIKKGKHGGTLVVLVNDLDHVGKQGDLVEVKPGYARNYLLPYGLAVIPTTENIAIEIWRRIAPRLSSGSSRLEAVRVYETEDLYVDYFGEPSSGDRA